MTDCDFLDAVERICSQLEDMLKARGVCAEPFPARRHDEKGWLLGSVLTTHEKEAVLNRQHHVTIPVERWQFPEDYLRMLVDFIAESGTPLLSAYGPMTPAGWASERRIVEGFHCRFLKLPSGEGMRCDVLTGQLKAKAELINA